MVDDHDVLCCCEGAGEDWGDLVCAAVDDVRSAIVNIHDFEVCVLKRADQHLRRQKAARDRFWNDLLKLGNPSSEKSVRSLAHQVVAHPSLSDSAVPVQKLQRCLSIHYLEQSTTRNQGIINMGSSRGVSCKSQKNLDVSRMFSIFSIFSMFLDFLVFSIVLESWKLGVFSPHLRLCIVLDVSRCF